MGLFLIITSHTNAERYITQITEKEEEEEEDIFELVDWMRYLQKWTHSTNLELVWTVIPTILLIAIAVPSFILLYSLDEIVDTQSVVRIIAYQWYWKYEYPSFDLLSDDVLSFSYLSYMLPLDDLTEENNLRLLEVDSPLILPTNVNCKLIITSKDVIHSFAVPSLGIKMDAVPGRLNQVTAHIFKPGVYYGQCSELCGVNHAFMPIVINAVHFSTFESFLYAATTGTTFELPEFPNEPETPDDEPETPGKNLDVFFKRQRTFDSTIYALLCLYEKYVEATNSLLPRHKLEALFDVINVRNDIFINTLKTISFFKEKIKDNDNLEEVELYTDYVNELKNKLCEIFKLETSFFKDNDILFLLLNETNDFVFIVETALQNPFSKDFITNPSFPTYTYKPEGFLGLPINFTPEYCISLFYKIPEIDEYIIGDKDHKHMIYNVDMIVEFLKNKYTTEINSRVYMTKTLSALGIEPDVVLEDAFIKKFQEMDIEKYFAYMTDPNNFCELETPVSNNLEEKEGTSETPVSNNLEEKEGTSETPVSNNLEEKEGTSETPVSNNLEEKEGTSETPVSNTSQKKKGIDTLIVIIGS
jgi:cytochrome c oxidase subunit 2